MYKFLILLFLLLSNLHYTSAQWQTSKSAHYLLGVDVEGIQIGVPFSVERTREAWKEYSKAFGKSEATGQHESYQTVFEPETYDQEVLIFSQIVGDSKQSNLWVAIDPQGVPKEKYPLLQEKLDEFIYQFNIKMRKDAAQKKIDESEQAATYLSKEYESLKRDERGLQKNYEKTGEKIKEYEQKLIELRNDSTVYLQQLYRVQNSLDSLYNELEQVKKVVKVYQDKLKEID